MIIRRSLTLNPVEPQPLSFRAATGLETKLDVTFFRPNGDIVREDIGGQLQLTARTTGITTTYVMPSTDMLNGKARAVLPAMADPNGYRLRLIGTVYGERELLAIGNVIPIEAAGAIETTPDVIDTINLSMAYNVDATILVTIWNDTAKQSPYDLGSATITADVLAARDGSVLASFVVTESGNVATLFMPAGTINLLPPACWWRLVASNAAGSQTLAEGNVTITGTPP